MFASMEGNEPMKRIFEEEPEASSKVPTDKLHRKVNDLETKYSEEVKP